MKTINIVVFENDRCFLSLLKGYCYANHIEMTESGFNRDGINKLEQIKPDLIIISLDLISTSNKRLETDLLMRIVLRNQLTICGLNKSSTDSISPGLSEWIDVIINDPFEISEIDRYLKKTFYLLNIVLTEKRRGEKRRSDTERRRAGLNGKGDEGYKETKIPGNQHKAEHPAFKNLQIDQRSKCVILKGKKVFLTPKEFELIELLLTDVDRTFMTDEIINHLWPDNKRATKSDLYQYMHLLRKKIEEDPNNPQWIMTVKGFGYRLNIDEAEEMHHKIPERQIEPVT